MTTMGDHIDAMKAEGLKRGQDVCYGVRWEYQHDTMSNIPVEMRVEFLDPGKFPKVFLDPTTDALKAAGQHWDEAWTILRVMPQPAAQIISLTPGKFLPSMPNIEFPK